MKYTFHAGDPLPDGLTEVTDSVGDLWVKEGGSSDKWVCHTSFSTYRERWVALTSSYSGLLTGEVPDTGSPRTWSAEPPADVKLVRTTAGVEWSREDDADRWYRGGSPVYPPVTWGYLIVNRGPLTEVTETDYDAAVRRLRTSGYLSGDSLSYPERDADIRVIVERALKGDQ